MSASIPVLTLATLSVINLVISLGVVRRVNQLAGRGGHVAAGPAPRPAGRPALPAIGSRPALAL